MYLCMATFGLCLSFMAVSALAQRGLPEPLPHHPGNVFLAGEHVRVSLPDMDTVWTLVDYEGQSLRTVQKGTRMADIGPLPVGFYRLRSEQPEKWVSLAVLAPLKAPTPATSPIGTDAAMAWFYPEGMMADAASLAALAGMNWVRDRLAWGHMEPEQGRFVVRNHYDTSAEAQAAASLRVLQVNHSTPSWAGPDGGRFPRDLRHAYRFYREMAARWKGKVLAFEPWNEADIEVFGGHTGSEMAAFQKASYLGLKAGNPEVIACLNVFAGHNPAQLQDLHSNVAWPYFDTYNLHHYEAFEAYPKLYGDHRAVSAGRPLWVTECALPVRWSGDPKLQELSEEMLREQSERIAKVFAGSLHEGSRATFYFILGHYVEGQTQFGLIRKDLTPRPGYVALAAVGRFLADARALGKLRTPEGVLAYAFRAKPDGVQRVVIVAWCRQGSSSLQLPVMPVEVADHLGRMRPASMELTLTTAPTFVFLSSGAAKRLSLEPPPKTPRRLSGTPSPIVIQPLFSKEQTLLYASAYKVSSSQPTEIRMAVYNFADRPARGVLNVTPPPGWTLEGPRDVALDVMDRRELVYILTPKKPRLRAFEVIRFTGDFGEAGKPVASLRIAPDATGLTVKPGAAVLRADDPTAWDLLVSGGPAPTVTKDDGLIFEASPTGDPWFYPRLRLEGKPPIPRGTVGIACTITLLEGDAIFRAIFDEASGASYVSDFVVQPKLGEPVQTVALFASAVHGAGWSPPDPNGRLDLDQVVTIKIGCNSKGGKVRFKLSNVRWVRE